VFQYPENAVTLTSSTERGRALELPFLAKYHFLSEHRTWRPFVTAGPTVRRTSLDASRFATILSGVQQVTLAPQLSSGSTVKWTVDPAVGAGVDFKAGRFHLEPEVRYSYWGAGKDSLVRKNQVDFLLGFRF
jgi:outer membrane protein W